MLNVALLSRWHVHADDYAREASENENVSIELVWDEEVERGEKWAKELGVPFEGDLHAVLSNPAIDAVIVNTPTNLHKEIILAAATKKKHIFTEKVLAFSREECEEIFETVDEQGVNLMVSLPRLTESCYLYAQKVVNKGLLGKLTMIRCRLAHNGAVPIEGKDQGWLPERFFDKEQCGGGSLIDLGAHPIYLTNRLAGSVLALNARLQQTNGIGVDDNAVVLLEYESGALGVVETSFLSNGSPFQLELYGTEGTLLMEDEQIRLKSRQSGEGEWVIPEEVLPALPMPMQQWIRAIKDGTAPTITREDVVNLTTINEAAAVSHKKGRRIELRELAEQVNG
ncbi:dehydrogenase [Virgibacillus phasianinus]|uniref:Dehydrogenase n=1 Tax=Virgibacillus phasianinus TaxID=2017483 RepID=A0A220TY72_9BACI|nr:Gfo/Idh/MocA family oxidoreductase [Virgibacillus phasianinus]ASK60705.1 dehydrogenase [Virgibacillus phasianinus]